MCGYCFERQALNILKEDVQGNLQMKSLYGGSGYYFYLRESPDFIGSLERLRNSLAHKRVPFESEVSTNVLLYRGIEILMKQGFDSPEYQRLLKKPLYRNTIVSSCTNQNQNQFEVLTEGLQIEHLRLLYDPATFFRADRSKQLRTLTDVLPSCRNLLKHYISWWLDGNNLKRADLMAKINTLGLMEQINKGYEVQTISAKFSRAKDFRFDLLTRALYFSILVVGSCSAGKKMLLAIAGREPAETPGFSCDDLWLQRVAALKLFDLEGFEFFSKHITSIRATNYYYINIMRGFSPDQMQRLLDEAMRNPDEIIGDDYISLIEWLSSRSSL